MTCPHCGHEYNPFPAFPLHAVDAMLEQGRIDAAAHRAEVLLAVWERRQREGAERERLIRQAKAEQRALTEVIAWVAANVKKEIQEVSK